MAETTHPSTSETPLSAIDPIDNLPLSLLRSDTVPPAPTRTGPPGSTIDWLPSFADYSWVAYGASSLLVISHFPSPLSSDEAEIGPIYRQVFELSGVSSSSVNAVSWSPVVPSIGELAAAAENCIWVFSHDSSRSKGSFCWSQNAVLVQSTKVEAVGWNGSGDGIIAGGVEVVLWKRFKFSWEIAWKFKADCPQTLVSATWSIEGPSAMAVYTNKLHIEASVISEARKCVSVCQNDGRLGYGKVELNHPLPVSMIQWRPASGIQSNDDAKHSRRNVLLTCCLDGTVRLWSEIDNGRVRKIGKDDHKAMKRSFCIVAVIEINHSLSGTLGMDVHVSWGTEIAGIFEGGEGAKKFFPSKGYEHEKAGSCEWIIAFGPGMLVSFWAIHCLDDLSPLRFPRVTLWKKVELQGSRVGHSHRTELATPKEIIFLSKTAVLRNNLCGPPTMCSLIQLLPCNTLLWSLLHIQNLNNIEDSSLNNPRRGSTQDMSVGFLNLDGHTGKLLQVAVHPYSAEVELAVSLDSNGLLLFWSLSTISNCILGRPTLVPAWELYGKLVTQNSCSKYTSLRWVPLLLDQELVLLVGHVGGVDCFVVKIYQKDDENIECHYICTIPFTGHGPYEEGPSNIFSVPLPSTEYKTLKSHRFMLLAVWMNGFQALSWEVIFHSYDISGSSCECNFESKNGSEGSTWGFGSTFAGKRYCVSASPSSSQLPEPHNHDCVSSYGVVCPGSLVPMQETSAPLGDQINNYPAYCMATGCASGCLKLWRSKLRESSTPHTPWELVGMCMTEQGPISAVCLTDCGRKVATISKEFHSNAVSTLHVWDSVHIAGRGTFMLEDTITLDGQVVGLNWLALGNGQFLLGVCMQNQLRVYAQRHCGNQTLLNSGKVLKEEIWLCIAFSHTSTPIRDFFWGPRATPVVVHDSYLSVYSQWLFLVDKENQAQVNPVYSKDNCLDHVGEKHNTHSAIFTDCNVGELTELSLEDCSKGYNFGSPAKTNMEKDCRSSSLLAVRAQLENSCSTKLGLWSMLEVVESLSGSLQVYHPQALLVNIYAGNWRRAYLALKHLVDSLTHASEKRCGARNSSHIVPQIPLPNYFEGLAPKNSPDKGFHWGGDATLTTSSFQSQNLSQFAYNLDPDASNNLSISSSTKSELSAFIEPLEKLYQLAAISDVEKTQIIAVIDLLVEVTNPHGAYGSLDEPGQRFWVAFKFRQLYFFRRFSRPATMEELVTDSSLIIWAYHSDCQENLFGSVLPNEPSWPEMRKLGVGFWFTNTAQLRTKMEKLARLQYLKNKDPKACALLYIALNRIQVLAGLFKISKNEKDKPLVGFLSRNFQEEKNKAAALKNAYVLMGKHQLELAIAFFLLGGDISSAVNVCAKNLGDEQLALVICRLVEGCRGPSEHHLITKILLPSAIEKGDYWLASLLEWELGNYCQSFMRMLGFKTNSAIQKPAMLSNHFSFLDPNVGVYCLTLATKNSMRNAIGDQNTAILGRWAILMTATALSRCGLPLEALECLSSSSSILGNTNQGNLLDIGHSDVLHEMLKPSSRDSSNWLSDDVAFCLECNAKSDLALKYFSKLIREHPSWEDIIVQSALVHTSTGKYENHQYVELLESFRHKFCTGLEQYDQKFSLDPFFLISKILVLLYTHGLLLIGYDLLYGYIFQDRCQDETQMADSIHLNHLMKKPLFKVAGETSLLLSRFIVSCSVTCSQLKLQYIDNDTCESGSLSSNAWGYQFRCLMSSLCLLRASLRIRCGSVNEDLIMKPLMILDLIEYYVNFAYVWLQRNTRGLVLMMQPLIMTHTNGHTPYEDDLANLKKLLPQMGELVSHSLSHDDLGNGPQVSEQLSENQGNDIKHSIPEDERWKIMGACLWQHMSRFMNHKLNKMSFKLDDICFSGMPLGRLSSGSSSAIALGSDVNSSKEQIELVSLSLVKLLKTTVANVSSYHVKQLSSYLHQKREYGNHVRTLVWLQESSKSQNKVSSEHLDQNIVKVDMINGKKGSDTLWDICADPKMISESFAQEKISWLHLLDHKPSQGWSEIYKGIRRLDEAEETQNHEGIPGHSSATNETGSPARRVFQNGHTFLSSWQKDTTLAKEVKSFLSPKEITKRNGELLEALCINSIHQGQAAVASHRKGIIFFNWEDEMPFRDQSDYIWSEADWPLNGWAGSESTPAPTCVSPGIGLGSKKGAHLGLGGATVGVGPLGRPRRDLTGGGAFGIPGYAGIGASSLGWETQEDFEEFIDPLPTAENISARAFSSHPSRPFFLVGSRNTHIYLWEFGKDKATATYGVLPAPNVPPPYALASISALQFDHCGHRFSTAALDGTVCTWQLEVGGRSNIRPTESSHCFDGHASDVTYFTSSGSIIAAAGYSSNNVNVVIWDTLAPPRTSRASIICHEGGARSLSVFDNDITSGSISPLIVTGGKSGDVGVHDFRYIATGKSKRHKLSDNGEQTINTSSNIDAQTGNSNKVGEQNLNGMLWYIPKAHSGSVTKVATIPNTSLFLTGSKDGDVKLWDAKKAKMLCHWSKLHERHTFLQPSSRGFGGVVRAAVTDIQVVTHGFLTCGGDGSVKLIGLKDHHHGT